MTLPDHIDIELILIEASAYSLRNEVKELAIELLSKDKDLLEIDAYTLAFSKTILEFNV